ncbi:hypothetical protein BS78_10G225900 [Paspalum vaginatum]|nr:hypothetical protein BS78_10G225900 [Paspalum vaginatum]
MEAVKGVDDVPAPVLLIIDGTEGQEQPLIIERVQQGSSSRQIMGKSRSQLDSVKLPRGLWSDRYIGILAYLVVRHIYPVNIYILHKSAACSRQASPSLFKAPDKRTIHFYIKQKVSFFFRKKQQIKDYRDRREGC